MKTNQISLSMMALLAAALVACTEGGQQGKGNDDTLKSQGQQGIQTLALSAEEADDSAERAAQDTMAYHAVCDTCDACDNSARWLKGTTGGGGIEITPDKARDDVQRFYTEHGMISGGFISKLALDSIFCHHKNYNGIYTYVAKDGAGNYFMVIEGWEDKDGSDKARVNITLNPEISGSNKFQFFRTELMCPTVCGYAGM
jgi:hypothetical protein